MALNKFVWDMYKHSAEGEKSIKTFRMDTVQKIEEIFIKTVSYQSVEKKEYSIDIVMDLYYNCELNNYVAENRNNRREIIKCILSNGLSILDVIAHTIVPIIGIIAIDCYI